MLVVERLAISEWEKLTPIFHREFQTDPPSPTSSMVIVAKECDTGRVVGLLAVQPIVHAEPLWVAEEYRGRHITEAMIKKAKSILKETREVMVYTTSERVGKLLTRLGLEHMTDWRVFKWVGNR